MARKFAEGTTVQAGSTKGQIEDLLTSHGCDRYGTMADFATAWILFQHEGIGYKISIQLPDPDDKAFTEYVSRGTRYARADTAARDLYVKELNRRWRALYMVMKAKLVAVDEGITTFVDEFLSHAVLPGGDSFGEHYAPELRKAALDGRMPGVLELPGRRK
jgi:hypothetical protein